MEKLNFSRGGGKYEEIKEKRPSIFPMGNGLKRKVIIGGKDVHISVSLVRLENEESNKIHNTQLLSQLGNNK